MLPFRTLRHLALPLLLASTVTLPAQIVTNPDLPEKPRLEIDTEVENGLQLTWFGREGFSYFLQTTTDLVSEPWQYLPVIETGHDAELEYGLIAPSPRFFARIVLSEQTAANPMTADFDGDGISNMDELNRMIDPLANRDDDNDGHPDDWERYYFNDTTTTNDAFADQDTDGLSDYEEAMRGTDPELDDTDGDGVLDGVDGWPRHNWLTVPPLPEARYAVIPLKSLGWPEGAHFLNQDTLDERGRVYGGIGDGSLSFDPATRTYQSLTLAQLTTAPNPYLQNMKVNGSGYIYYTIWSSSAGKFLPGLVSPEGQVLQPYVPESLYDGISAWPRAVAADGRMAVQEYRYSSVHGPIEMWVYLLSPTGAKEELSHYVWSGVSPSVGTFSRSIAGGHFLPSAINASDVMAGAWTSKGNAVGGYVSYETRGMVYADGQVLLDEPGMGFTHITEGLHAPMVALSGWENSRWAHADPATGQWSSEALTVWNPATRTTQGVYGADMINERLEIADTSGSLIRNGTRYSLKDLIETGWHLDYVRGLNNQGVLAAEARRTIDAAGLPIPPANQVTEPVLLVPYYLAQAEGEEAGRALISGAPVYEPNDGIGKGVPIYHDPAHNISLSFAGPLSSVTADTATCVLWGTSVTLTETAPTSLVFQNSGGTVVVTLTEEPVLDSGVLERLSVIVTAPAYDLLAATYPLAETDAGTSVFQDVLVSASVRYDSLTASTIDTLDLSVTDEMHSIHRTLTETAPDSGIFADEFYSVRLSGTGGGSFVPGASGLSAFITAAPAGLNNTRVNLGQVGTTSGGHYRNMEPATPTNLPASTLPDHAKWKLKMGIPPALAQSLGLALKTTKAQESVTFSTTPDANGFYESVASFVMVPDHVTETLVDGAVALKVKTDQIDWSAATGDLELFLGAVGNGIVAASAKVQQQAVVLQSLDVATKAGQGLDTEERIKNPLEGLGYTVYMDLHAKTPKTLSDYIIGKQVWYSMSHGVTETGRVAVGMGEFKGLNFIDAKTAGTITTNRIKDLGLNYNLVMVDGCGSAQTDMTDAGRARDTEQLMDEAKAFARAFGPEAAYVGWGYTINPLDAQTLMAEFVARLKGKPTVGASFVLYRKDMNIAERTNTNLLKLYGKRTNKIDLNSTR